MNRVVHSGVHARLPSCDFVLYQKALRAGATNADPQLGLNLLSRS